MSLLKSHLTDTIPWRLDGGEPVPERFSEVAEEVDKLTHHAAMMDFSHRGVVTISGPERVAFLQGLTTNQIKDVSPDKTLYTAMLTPQGRFQWDFSVGTFEESLFLDTEPQQAARLIAALSFYLMRTKAALHDVSSEYGTLAVAGPQATEAIAALFPQLPLHEAPLGATFNLEGDQQLWRDPRHGDFGWRLRVKGADYPAVWEKWSQSIPTAGADAWEQYRIQQGLPKGGKELIFGQSLPLEGGLLEMNGVSFQKGCFVGQETTARTHHRGTLKKRLFQVILEGDGPVAAETPILTPSGKEAGILTSTICQGGKCIGLSTLRLSDVSKGNQLTAAGRNLSVHKPQWADWELK
ncbi:MAG: folate-binding protein YgfZ [Magnetococcales bacterium]|nr:folate-binding protein YgfZ [Magnetococcales bacterium]